MTTTKQLLPADIVGEEILHNSRGVWTLAFVRDRLKQAEAWLSSATNCRNLKPAGGHECQEHALARTHEDVAAGYLKQAADALQSFVGAQEALRIMQKNRETAKR